jgi:hypothetical protein
VAFCEKSKLETQEFYFEAGAELDFSGGPAGTDWGVLHG